MAGHRLVGVGTAAVAAAVILSGCSFGGAVRQAPNPTTGRAPVELTRMDATAVAIFNAAVPRNAGTAGASATGQAQTGGAGAGTGTGPAGTGTTAPGTTGTGTTGTGTTGTGTTGTTPPTGTGTTGAGTTGTGTPGTGTTGTTPPTGTTGTGTTGAGTTGAGTTGATPPAGTGTAPGTSTGGATGTPGATGTSGGTGATGTGTTGPGATGTSTGTTASPGVTSRTTPSTGPTVDWTRIQDDFRSLSTTWGSARTIVKGNGANGGLLTAVDDAVSSLGSSITSRNPMATAMAANDLTAYTTALLGMYRTAPPVQIYNMEYLAREVELDTENGNQEGALDAAREIGAVWASLRAGAMARYRTHAGAIDAEVGRLAADVASGANLNLRNDAATLLRDVQILTRDYVTGTATR